MEKRNRTEYFREWNAANKERRREVRKAWEEANRETIREKARQRKLADPEKRRQKEARYREKYREKLNERERLRFRKIVAENPGALAHYAKKYQGSLKRATPRWLSREQKAAIEILRFEARVKSLLSGVAHTVDHAVPLQSEIVCGLHVPWNIRVVTKSENSRKSNRQWLDMWENET